MAYLFDLLVEDTLSLLGGKMLKYSRNPLVAATKGPCLSSPILFTSIRGYSQTRFHNGKKTSKNTNQTSKEPNGGHKKKLLILGLLAIGTTALSLSYQKNNPIEFIEPQKEKKQKKMSTTAFTPDQVSVIFVLGGPGAGKGTQCAKLVADYGFVHLSAGDLLRAEQNREGSEFGTLIKHYITEGLIVPQEITLALLKNAIQENYDKGMKKFLVDGFPRKMDQALSFEEQIVPSKFILFFDCPEDVMLERLLDRGKTSGRVDDNIESIKKRFKTFEETSMPVVKYFEDQHKVIKIRCDSPVDDVYKQVKAAVDERIN
ncbi:hypothetical protein NCAS_0H03560 [Naumovozyma castellii]|uniref:Uridylate kinase n=1 Tax=Naumovozyma castellii TaxID=27288 RepID=G0VJI6_NAUCA|nr:hypothetical protein NCAS_0H03560 [Naumovozyma castellii CBS 4309]CCC71666.1 hypothetical protein NCAS_0H03560 [Naumovozyma castellii CBS 4309]